MPIWAPTVESAKRLADWDTYLPLSLFADEGERDSHLATLAAAAEGEVRNAAADGGQEIADASLSNTDAAWLSTVALALLARGIGLASLSDGNAWADRLRAAEAYLARLRRGEGHPKEPKGGAVLFFAPQRQEVPYAEAG